MTTNELIDCFFTDLKKYNPTNFKTLERSSLDDPNDPVVLKSFSSVITRAQIFREKHPEISQEEFNILYFKLKIDLIAAFFMELPDGSLDDLRAFQKELKHYVRKNPEKYKSIEKEAV